MECFINGGRMEEETIHRHLDDIIGGGKFIYNNVGDKKPNISHETVLAISGAISFISRKDAKRKMKE